MSQRDTLIHLVAGGYVACHLSRNLHFLSLEVDERVECKSLFPHEPKLRLGDSTFGVQSIFMPAIASQSEIRHQQ